MDDRSGVTGGTLGSEARSATSQYDDGERDSGSGLPPIPEGDADAPPLPNATVSEGAEVGQKAAEVPRLSPVRSGRKSGGQSWLTDSDDHECVLALSQVTDSYSSLGSPTPRPQAIPDSHHRGEGSKPAAATRTQG